MSKIYYHFSADKLRDGRPIPPVGEWLVHTGELEICRSGLHASEHPFDALMFAPGCLLHKVQLGRKIIKQSDKVVSNRRKILATINTEDLCRTFARRVALDVVDKWDCPAVVREYLETGNEKLKETVWSAAWAAQVAAESAAQAAGAAAQAARSAAWAAQSAAHLAAQEAARGAAVKNYSRWFLEAVNKEFEKS